MKKNSIIIIVLIIIVIIIGIWAYSSGTSTQNNLGSYNNTPASNSSTAPGTDQTSPNNQISNQTAQLFSDSPFAQNAYLISGTAAFDANTKLALTGFSIVKKTLSDGSV